ncbi:hypothetical protein [Actinomadura kijaniata]|uniref:hypothetical protein n=1 Tax=Actinomadura kijaniata TaxID=46161 RepID=UPI0008314FEF|nr:hypothetical protein [Actinomadura kijaniata]
MNKRLSIVTGIGALSALATLGLGISLAAADESRSGRPPVMAPTPSTSANVTPTCIKLSDITSLLEGERRAAPAPTSSAKPAPGYVPVCVEGTGAPAPSLSPSPATP